MAIAIPLALLSAACGSPTPKSGAQATSAAHTSSSEPSPGGSAGQVYAQKVLVTRVNGRFEWITLFIVGKKEGGLAIVDSNGEDYRDLDDFRANNDLLSEDDKITLPRDFPSTDTSRDVKLMTVSGHTGGTPWAWWLTGGIAVVLISGGAFLWSRARSARRWSAREFGSDADPQEPAP
jgi:hypothetical protein